MIASGIPAKMPTYNRAAENFCIIIFSTRSLSRALECARLLAVPVVLLISFDRSRLTAQSSHDNQSAATHTVYGVPLTRSASRCVHRGQAHLRYD
jgi:hypothetical protein